MSEHFIQDVIFELADYFLCVVNDFTSLDQRYLDKLTRNLQSSKKDFREVIVVHNCKEVIDEEHRTRLRESLDAMSRVDALETSGLPPDPTPSAHAEPPTHASARVAPERTLIAHFIKLVAFAN
mgnify:CR=1 FL=1